MKNLKEVNDIVKSLDFYKGEIERSRAVKYEKEITLARLASRNLYLDEDEFLLLQNTIQKILIDRNMKFEKELSRYQIIENGM
jgi:hypothetical protein